MDELRVKPTNDPEGRLRRVYLENRSELLPPTGGRVPRSQYWLRQLRNGNVEPVKRAAKKKE